MIEYSQQSYSCSPWGNGWEQTAYICPRLTLVAGGASSIFRLDWPRGSILESIARISMGTAATE